MILERPNPSQLVLQVLAQNVDGSPKTLLSSAAARVYHVNSAGSELVDLASVSLVQVGSTNTWRYRWVSPSLTVGQYFVEYTLIDTDGMQFIGTEDLAIQDYALQADVELFKKLAQGRWKVDEVTSTMTFYDDDGTTPILTFALKDINGLPASVNVFERVPV